MSVLSTLRSFFDLSHYGFRLLHAQDQRPKQPSAFRFLDLSAELRNTIYYLALVSDKPLFIPSACKHDDEPTAAHPALTRVNRQIRAECLQLFYAENKFYTHIHRCDFGYFFEYMDVIGDKNRGYIREVCMHLKDRLTCGEGGLSLLRWCTTTPAIKNLQLTFDVSGWNLENAEWMDDDDREEMLKAPEQFHKYTKQQVQMYQEVIPIARKLVDKKRTSEWEIGKAHKLLLARLRFFCCDGNISGAYCVEDYDDETQDPRKEGDAFHGICSFIHPDVREHSQLAPDCSSRSQGKVKRQWWTFCVDEKEIQEFNRMLREYRARYSARWDE